AAVLAVAQFALARLENSLAMAAAERAAAEEARTVREGELLALRGRVRELADELDVLTGAVHRDEVARTEQRMRIGALEDGAAEECGVEAETLVAEYGPDVLVPIGEDAPPIPYVREEQEKRLRAAERVLALLGKINPLALEEFAALEERHAFLASQL